MAVFVSYSFLPQDAEQSVMQGMVSRIKKKLTPSRGATTKFTVYDENNSTVVTNRPNPTPNLPEVLFCEDVRTRSTSSLTRFVV